MKYKIWQTHEYDGHNNPPKALKKPLDETENICLFPDGRFMRIIPREDGNVSLWEMDERYFKLEILEQ
jgi:hypothetical protein